MNKRLLIFLGAILVGFAGLVAFSKMNTSGNLANAQGSNNVYGKLDSKVQLTEYVDFQCEACFAFYPTVKQIKEKYKDKIKFQIKNFPITTSHPNALAAAATAQAAAKQGKFFEMHDLLLERQKIWENVRPSERNEVFTQYAQEIGLNMEQFKTDVDSSETNSIIQADLAEVKRLGGTGTPTFSLNGKKIDNPANNVEAFTKVLEEALENSDTAN